MFSPKIPMLGQFGFVAFLIVVISLLLSQEFAIANKSNNGKNVNRKSIVFDIKTPKVFYCPQEKQSDFSKTIVKAKPLEKLCEFEGQLKPKNTPSDCYNDVDETEFACDEKKRFLLRLDPPSDTAGLDQMITTTIMPDSIENFDSIVSKDSRKKKTSQISKKF